MVLCRITFGAGASAGTCCCFAKISTLQQNVEVSLLTGRSISVLLCSQHEERVAFLVAWLVCSSFFAVVASLRLILSDLHLLRQLGFVPPQRFREGLLRA